MTSFWLTEIPPEQRYVSYEIFFLFLNSEVVPLFQPEVAIRRFYENSGFG